MILNNSDISKGLVAVMLMLTPIVKASKPPIVKASKQAAPITAFAKLDKIDAESFLKEWDEVGFPPGFKHKDKLNKLIENLVIVESGGDPSAVGDKGRALGVLQIHKEVVLDANNVLGTSYKHKDMFDARSSKVVARAYLSQHYNKLESKGKLPTDENLARIWNGGPDGWQKQKDNSVELRLQTYWSNVQKVMHRQAQCR